jgi:hypothetical protein
MDANALDLPLEPAPQLIASADQEELELDARAAGVENQNGYSVMAQIRIGSFAIWL